MFVDGNAVAAFLGQGDDPTVVALAGRHVPIVTALAKSYTRDKGFDVDGEPLEDVAAVIVTATARMVANPEQLQYDAGSVRMRSGFQGWSLAELTVLNRYRKKSIG